MGKLSCRFRELGGLIRIAGDIAVQEGAPLIEAAHVRMAWQWSLLIEEQMALPHATSGIRHTQRIAP